MTLRSGSLAAPGVPLHVPARAPALALVAFLAPALAGCLGGDAATVAGNETASAPLAGSSTAESGIAAPSSAFRVPVEGEDGSAAAAETIHPFVVEGQEARAAETIELAGEYRPEDCAAPAGLVTGRIEQAHDFAASLRPGDAVTANVTLRWTNAPGQSADLHLAVDVPGQSFFDTESAGTEMGERAQSFAFQFSYPGGPESSFAVASVSCWWAANAITIPYAITVELAFAEGVIPAGTPHLLRASENVRELRVTGARASEGAPVVGHYRVFRPDDTLLGEFALNSNEAFDAVALEGPGDYVVIVDHSEGGMLAFGADAPPADPRVVVLSPAWQLVEHYATPAPGPVDLVVALDFPRVPLGVFPWFRAAEGSVSAGKKVALALEGPEGRVARVAAGMPVGVETPQGGITIGVPSVDEYAFEVDHHAFAEGPHTARLTADAFHGVFFHWQITYLRPGETEAPAPTVGGISLRTLMAAPAHGVPGFAWAG